MKPGTNQLGVIIRHLLKLRGLRAFELSERIGNTPISLSKINRLHAAIVAKIQGTHP